MSTAFHISQQLRESEIPATSNAEDKESHGLLIEAQKCVKLYGRSAKDNFTKTGKFLGEVDFNEEKSPMT